jgi:hypothetical protein
MTWMPQPVVMKLGMYILLPEAILTATSQIPSTGNTNIEDSQIVEVVTSLLLKCLK